MKFTHKVSKGSVYKQVYIPKEMESYFEAGDIVEVHLIERKNPLFYSKNLKEISNFKIKFIKKVFSLINKFKDIEQIFVFGSFLKSESEYKDIDIMLISNKENIEEEIYNKLTKEFGMKFHVISINKEKLNELLKICPLTRSMLYDFISNKKFQVSKENKIDINHLKFLMMMPKDLLKIALDKGKIYYNSLRKLISIEFFIKNKEISPDNIDIELEKLLKKNEIQYLKEDGLIKGKIKEKVESVLKNKLNSINNILNI